jgi:DNA invertase Pin-like site-specific DNA recombinase
MSDRRTVQSGVATDVHRSTERSADRSIGRMPGYNHRIDERDLKPLLGYTSAIARTAGHAGDELREQTEIIMQECRRRGVRLGEMIRERTSQNGRKALERPGLGYALDRIAAGDAAGVVVSDLSRLSRSAADLGTVLAWFSYTGARLIVVAESIDTATTEGRVTVGALIGVADRERERLAARTRNGLQAARESAGSHGRPAVADDHELHARIVGMRAQGMTLQAIADRLNDEGVPTVRGGTQWRPSSIQGALGLRRPRRHSWLPEGAAARPPATDDDGWESR